MQCKVRVLVGSVQECAFTADHNKDIPLILLRGFVMRQCNLFFHVCFDKSPYVTVTVREGECIASTAVCSFLKT